MSRFSTGKAFRMRGRPKLGAIRGREGKPYHPPLTDIPVAAYIIAPVMDVIAFAGRNEAWSRELFLAAGWVLLAGAAVSLATAATGFADWLATDKGTELRKVANSHALAMVTVTLLVLANLAARFLTDLRAEPSGLVLGLSVAIGSLVSVGAMIGGAMVYDYGFNVRRPPTAETEQPAYRRAV